MKHGVTRQQIVAAADDLFYRQGFECTSFADITAAVNISRGNLYHHFKVKDDILDAVIEARLCKTQDTLGQWEADGATPMERIELYVKSLLCNWPLIKEHGCPVGTLCTELAKLDHDAREDSVKILALFRQWLKNQFLALNSVEDPDVLAMQVLSWSQGVASMGNAFKDLQYVKREVQKMCDWLQAVPLNPK
ncbi:TetR/AcrR family transcriptional regulator [Ferrimonas sp. YFM]|uniref:TetR/AcrR family transcriptional regulator n=1 Tax=Ferrimonas sp. YFM TaxID=3028878 RepID=UPI00257360D4|nr:TetR/AcrR family transcriptional regulator [Ferrimonas sp. YFM]BDY04458.1 TetR family transcriptional regulator [Ferrimonas sp. YFM]